MSPNPSRDPIHYFVEFMKFLCGFGLILAVSLTLLYFADSGATASLTFPAYT
jgi:hypothetical protein